MEEKIHSSHYQKMLVFCSLEPPIPLFQVLTHKYFS